MMDVARRAGVSVSTASLSFSTPDRVSPATREKVLTAAAELNYRGPNPLGRQLRSGRSDIVGVMVGRHLDRSLRDPFGLQVVNAVLTTLTAADFGVLLIPQTTGYDGTKSLLDSAAMDGVIMTWGAAEGDAAVKRAQRRAIPMVLGQGHPIPGYPQVYIDDRSASRRLGEHLVSLGHERIAIASLSMSRWLHKTQGLVTKSRLDACDFTTTRDRIAGVQDAGIVPVAVYEAGPSLLEAGQEAGRALLEVPADQRPTAIIAHSDVLAVGVIQAATELGLRVPEDLSVVGFDGIDLPWFTRKLTTMHQSGAAKGAALAELMIECINGTPAQVADVELAVEFVAGDTTGPAPV